jgi:hypothetical protein
MNMGTLVRDYKVDVIREHEQKLTNGTTYMVKAHETWMILRGRMSYQDAYQGLAEVYPSIAKEGVILPCSDWYERNDEK